MVVARPRQRDVNDHAEDHRRYDVYARMRATLTQVSEVFCEFRIGYFIVSSMRMDGSCYHRFLAMERRNVACLGAPSTT